MSWFTFNPIKYIQEEWNGEAGLGRYDPLHLVKELGAYAGFWTDNSHGKNEQVPVVKELNDWWKNVGSGWGIWILEIVFAILGILIVVMLLYNLIKNKLFT